MAKNRNFEAKVAPDAKIWTILFSLTLKFLFILISYDQYFGAKSSKLAENGIK